jgi:DNA topoisomerase-1
MGEASSRKRKKALVIVESPAKARTIGKYLGNEYFVSASSGHIIDLPPGGLGVDIKNGFRPRYRVIRGREKVVEQLKREAKKTDAIYLAADPDREGEAICYHLSQALNGESGRKIYRVLFNEITKKAILNAFEHPTEIDQRKVDAQQARRILDRIVGYQISPLLWKKVRSGLSAGRVQTVAARLIVDREREIRAFEPEEYWEFLANLSGSHPPGFEAKAAKLDGRKFKIRNQEEADQLLDELESSEFVVRSVTRKARKRRPVPPFITSKLQQDAVRRLGFTVKKTMSVAQKLYEGIELGDQGAVGLITYMRTDSTRVSADALSEVREYIGTQYGDSYLPSKAIHYRTKKGAQDAHEAIRPTSVSRTPSELKPFLSRDEARLYELIWKRFMASQMNPALFDQTEILIEAGRTEFRAAGSILKFDGFLKLYSSSEENKKGNQKIAEERELPEVAEGERLKVEEILPTQKFTQPPPRFNEASLVKALEDRGIGRPSTYQAILSKIVSRDYVGKEEGRFVPTELGEVVNDLLVGHFSEFFDYDYTAKLEQDLDQIEEGKEDWIETLTEFYGPFRAKVLSAGTEMKDVRRQGILTDGICEKCGSPMALKKGQYGEFLACTGYPKCQNTQNVVRVNGKAVAQIKQELDEKCPQCGSNLIRRMGKNGEFTSCGNYPECRYTKAETIGVRCPKCTEGELVKRRSKRRKVFYGCNRYPDCDFVAWKKPVPEACPNCGATFLLESVTKKYGTRLLCADKSCGYIKKVEEEVPAEVV